MPRTWRLPPDPGPEVLAVWDDDNRRWERDRGDLTLWWGKDPHRIVIHRRWPELLVKGRVLTDATAGMLR
jgi:hypothetical protein